MSLTKELFFDYREREKATAAERQIINELIDMGHEFKFIAGKMRLSPSAVMDAAGIFDDYKPARFVEYKKEKVTGNG